MATRRDREIGHYGVHNKAVGALAVAAIAISIFAMIISLFALSTASMFFRSSQSSSTNSSSGSLGSTIAGINQPLNSSALAVINNAPNSYFETAGLMALNRSINNQLIATASNVSPYVVNGKPSVIYLGSITCVWCGENRWAMALALSRFGNFTQLYQGYSAIGDSDVPTLYWSMANYNIPDSLSVTGTGITIGSGYSSNYINFLPIEWQGNIMGGFYIQSLPVTQQEVNLTGNSSYIGAFNYIVQLQNANSTSFKGTPYTIWGGSLVGGADAVDFGNSTPSGTGLPLTYETHAQILGQLRNPSDQFAWTEYAAADLYVAHVCKAISNKAPVCALSAIQKIEASA